MGEEVKKSRPAPDPNSAKFKLGQIAAKAYSDAMEAKARGEMVGWCASNFPVEIPETLGLMYAIQRTRQQRSQPEAAAKECAISVRARAIPMISAHMPEYLLLI